MLSKFILRKMQNVVKNEDRTLKTCNPLKRKFLATNFFFLFYVQIYSPAWSFRKVDSSSRKIVKNFVNIIQIKPKRIWIRYVEVVPKIKESDWAFMIRGLLRVVGSPLPKNKEARMGYHWMENQNILCKQKNINFIYLFIHSL